MHCIILVSLLLFFSYLILFNYIHNGFLSYRSISTFQRRKHS